MNDEQIQHMVGRFLRWKLPESFNPDGDITFKRTFSKMSGRPQNSGPFGTNLFDYEQADAMVRHMIEDLPGPNVVLVSDPAKRVPDKETILMHKRCIAEIEMLRGQVAALQPRAGAYDVIEQILGLMPRSASGFAEDLVWRLRKEIEELQPKPHACARAEQATEAG